MLELLERLCDGEGKEGDIELLEDLSLQVKDGSMCGLGQTAPNPVLTTIQYFRNEYIDHINGTCTAGQCKPLLNYRIDEEKCIGCTLCVRDCPVSCISGERRKPHVINAEECIKCGKCYDVCRFGAILV